MENLKLKADKKGSCAPMEKGDQRLVPSLCLLESGS